MRLYNLLLLAIFGSALMITSCSTVKETTETEKKVVKPLWSEQVSRRLAEEFVSQLDIIDNNGAKTVYLVGSIDGDEKISSGLEYDIELALVNTGQVSFIADKKNRDSERENRRSIASFETEDKFYNYCENLKVDIFIEGEVTGESLSDIQTSYAVDLKIVNVNTKEVKSWQKVITR